MSPPPSCRVLIYAFLPHHVTIPSVHKCGDSPSFLHCSLCTKSQERGHGKGRGIELFVSLLPSSKSLFLPPKWVHRVNRAPFKMCHCWQERETVSPARKRGSLPPSGGWRSLLPSLSLSLPPAFSRHCQFRFSTDNIISCLLPQVIGNG